MTRTAPFAQSDTAEWRRLHCSFGGKDANSVRFLAAGTAGGLICDRCNWQSLAIFLKAYVTASRRLRIRV
jgi:ClpX C4-type zinc finger